MGFNKCLVPKIYASLQMSSSPYLTRREAAEYVRAPSVNAFDKWVRHRGVSCAGRRGQVRLFTKDTLDRVLRHDALWTTRRRDKSTGSA